MLELLAVIALIALLASILAPVTVRVYRHAKSVIYGCYFFNQNRIEAFLSDTQDSRQMFYSTSRPVPYIFIETTLAP